MKTSPYTIITLAWGGPILMVMMGGTVLFDQVTPASSSRDLQEEAKGDTLRARKVKATKKKAKEKAGKKEKKRKKGKKGKKGKKAQDVACLSYVESTVETLVQYDTLYLEGFSTANVEWDVSFAAGKTVFDFSLPISSETEIGNIFDLSVPISSEAEIGNILTMIEGLETTDPDDTVSFDTKLSTPPELAAGSALCSNPSRLHVTIPKFVQTLCVGESCRPVVCPLIASARSDIPQDFGIVPSNTELLFGNNTNCALIKPEYWDEWVAFYFGDHALSLFGDGLYFQDGDDDGASNIMEYYGLDMSSLFVDTRKSSSAAPIIHHGLQDGPWPSAGTDPTLADTNGDLFNDGYQLAYDLLEGDVTEDTDGDGLTDFQEFRYSTNPFSSDTDSDGVSDWEEIEQGSDPLDPNDSLPSDVGSIDLSLSIGDPSGSHSERYTMMVGIIQHAAPYFGVVNTDVYSFPPGVYSINIRHRDSTLGTPDFDYYGGITWPPTLDFDVSIQDPEGLLGTHSESTSDFTIGKTATLTIIYTGGGGGCSGQQQDGSVRRRAQTCPAFPCSSYTSCAACLEERTRCDWVVNLKRCRKMGAGGGSIITLSLSVRATGAKTGEKNKKKTSDGLKPYLFVLVASSFGVFRNIEEASMWARHIGWMLVAMLQALGYKMLGALLSHLSLNF